MRSERRYRATHLNEFLREQGRSQRWLASKIGVHESYLSRVLSGQKTLSEDQAERVSLILGTSLFLLFELLDRNESLTQEAIPA